MKNLAVDWGNTRIKVGVFDGSNLNEKFFFEGREEFKAFLQQHHFSAAIVSSVSQDAQEISRHISVDGLVINLDYRTPLPITLAYKTPETLGVDRIAAACGALDIFQGRAFLVVDLGTCINYEFVDSDCVYHGGAISPGIQMRFQSMHTFTAKLPLVEMDADAKLIGGDTKSCLQSGVMNGVRGEINFYIDQYLMTYPNLGVVMCGGDAPLFENKLKPSIFVAPNLVLSGLNRILRHNAV